MERQILVEFGVQKHSCVLRLLLVHHALRQHVRRQEVRHECSARVLGFLSINEPSKLLGSHYAVWTDVNHCAGRIYELSQVREFFQVLSCHDKRQWRAAEG